VAESILGDCYSYRGHGPSVCCLEDFLGVPRPLVGCSSLMPSDDEPSHHLEGARARA